MPLKQQGVPPKLSKDEGVTMQDILRYVRLCHPERFEPVVARSPQPSDQGRDLGLSDT